MEKNKVVHYNWQARDTKGRIAIILANDVLEYRVLAGNNPPPGILEELLLDDLTLLDAAHAGHKNRKYRWQVEMVTCNYGSQTYRLRIERDPEWYDYPVKASLHITCNGKLPDTGRFWLGDLIPLLVAAGFLGIAPTGVDLWKAEMWEPESWNY